MAKEKPSESGNVPPPQPLAMVICDMIWADPSTGKRTMLGCFSELSAKHFPIIHPIIAVYVALTGGCGTVVIRLQLVDVDEENDPIFEWTGEVDFPSPRELMEFDFHIPNVSFPSPGEYRIQLFADGELILERRLFMKDAPGSDKGEA